MIDLKKEKEKPIVNLSFKELNETIMTIREALLKQRKKNNEPTPTR